jgi:quercetin dioxygenase-like cupin family protein
VELSVQRVSLAAGDVFSIAPGEPHAIGNAGTEVLRLVCMDCLFDAP